MKFFESVLPANQRRLLPKIGPLMSTGEFYLGGETAIALYLGHRRSVDFDWFSATSKVEPMQLALDLRKGGIDFQVDSIARGTLHGVAEGVRLSFFEYQYALLKPPIPLSHFHCSLASLEDLACMKLAAIAGRGSRKDFVDLYALGQSRFSLEKMLDLYQQKFQTLDVGHVLFSLSYFDDAEEESLPEMLWENSWAEVRSEIERWVEQYAKR